MSDTESPSRPSDPSKARPELSRFGMVVSLIGWLCLLIAAIGVPNTAFDWGLQLEFYGTATDLPDNYEVCAGLAAVGALIVGLTWFGRGLRTTWARFEGRRWAQVGVAAGAALMLVVIGRALQVVVLTNTYGSMLAYYAADGQADELRDILEDGSVPEEDIDEAVFRAVFHDQPESLAALLEHGADLRQSTSEEQSCVLAGASTQLIEVAATYGVGPERCACGDDLIGQVVVEGVHDGEVASAVEALIAAGWSPAAPYGASYRDPITPLELAKEREFEATIAVLEVALGG
ncbi:hypothetical protein G6O69_21705 [Pseudenhygromyxa sp. WMMC2535]|uniref:hypothetical protein n=1 Tax=Pseudenhygromyxa sp. WMMC2535 TaxID=2712867 RepID=UPI001595C226|nr:hypothetical protein [Pseudenhygromyxa sp. WMMC2535]NVB40471.1 hypothetical protein [Pseudenhygromyxa sp. WMMC2535]